MPQLVKHYALNRDTYAYATTVAPGYINVNIPGLQIVHYLITENNVPYFLSTLPDEVDGTPFVVPETEGEGMKVITQAEWDLEIQNFDNRQLEKRYQIIRNIRNEILKITDWIVIKAKEQEENLSLEFKTWRQNLRDIPNNNQFPTSFPTIPVELQNNQELEELYNQFYQIYQIDMINEPS